MSRRKQEPDAPLEDDPLWYKDAIVYELHPRAFHDSNNDGVGDFRGLVQKLDYLQDLGITALWLLPFYPSPLRDDGYDIANYTEVHPLYGSLKDFKLFLREAHQRGLRVITELVVNHTSDQHPWFQRARRAPAGSSERNFYVWSETADRYRDARIIFKDFEPSNWTWDPVAKAYYWHRFYFHQPDLNFENPAVRRAVHQAMDFWLGMGIDGLRLDAVPYLYEREGTSCENLPETHAALRELRQHVDEKFRNRMLLAEANQWPEDSVAYFGNGDECQMAFHFPVMPRLFMAIRMEDRFPILDILQQTPAIPENCQWALFLRNHDELTLEMVTDEDRDYMYRVYAQDPQARINLGIRRRLAPLLENQRGKIELMNGLLFSLPGTPVLYYGDEIGMGDNIYLGDRNGVRTPMQWSGERNAGFSQANPQRLYLPVIIDPEYHYEAINVEVQQKSPHSLLWWMKRLIALRKRLRAFGRGSLEFLHPDNHKVLAFVRRHGDERILVVANLSRHVQGVELDLSAFRGLRPVELLGRSAFPAVGERPYFLTLGSYAFYWFSLEAQPVTTLPAPAVDGAIAALVVAGPWEDVFRGKTKKSLEELLPQYLAGCRWFAGKNRQTEAAKIVETIPVPFENTSAQVSLVQVQYTEGDPETYVMPLAVAEAAHADEIQQRMPESVVARLTRKGSAESAVLYDPLGESSFAGAMVQALDQHRRFRRSDSELVAVPTQAFRQVVPQLNGEGLATVVRVEQSNTSVVYDQRLILKVFRRAEEGINPEVEVARFLTEQTAFPFTPPLVGTFEYRRSWGAPLTLAVVKGYVVNEGDAWGYTLDALNNYYDAALMGPRPDHPLPLPHKPISTLALGSIPDEAQHAIGAYLAIARLIGERTAEMHLALASAVDDPAFMPEPYTEGYRRSIYQSTRSQLRRTFEVLRKRAASLPELTQQLAARVLPREDELLGRLRRVLEYKIEAQRVRCHSDYHLGQLLYTGKDFQIIDFGGESSRPISDRRRKRSALSDVTGMLRSFSYAALTALQDRPGRPEDRPALEPWARLWHLWVGVAFFQAYCQTASRGTFLPKRPEELAALLDFYLLRQAIKQLTGDLAGSADRLQVPLHGLGQLLDTVE